MSYEFCVHTIAAEDKAQAALRGLVTGEKSAKTLAAHKIQLLQQAVQSEEQRYQKLLSQLRTQQTATASVHDAKLDAVQQEIDRIDSAQQKLALRAPIDGYIETIFVFENETADKFKSILKINPKLPDKVKGFLPESSQVLYRIGDTVLLRSSTRSDVTTSGVLVGATPQLVELPLRLRKIQEVKAWGREIYIQLPPKNDFFIGEKILISLKRKRK
jgi:multidrug resistance efflux pump